MSTPLHKTWPERELEDKATKALIPAWQGVMDEDEEQRARIRRGEINWPNVYENNYFVGTYGTYRPPTVDEFSSLTLSCFAYNPEIRKYERDMRARARRVGLPEHMIQQHVSQVLHQTFHLMHWLHFGRKVYYLDDTTYQLLMHTPLPKLPASVLSVPTHSFYLMLPPSAFTFAVEEDLANPQRVEGIFVSIDRIDPDADRREVAVFLTGEGKKNHADSNVAYFAIGLGGDAKLNTIRLGGARKMAGAGDAFGSLDPEGHMARTLPRLIFGLLLYLASEHPDIEPVPPVPREKFSNIRSPKQREAALKNQEAKLAKFSRLGYMHVGKKLGEEVLASVPEAEKTGGHWKLNSQVWVSGHHKMQFYGPNRMYRRPIWIQPYRKGPDMAEQLETKLRKIQRAQEAE